MVIICPFYLFMNGKLFLDGCMGGEKSSVASSIATAGFVNILHVYLF